MRIFNILPDRKKRFCSDFQKNSKRDKNEVRIGVESVSANKGKAGVKNRGTEEQKNRGTRNR